MKPPLKEFLKHDRVSDIYGRDLFSKLIVLQDVLPKETRQPIEVVNFLKLMVGYFPNTRIAHRIHLNIPITVAYGERSFSKLK